jgi:hypothetical protein
VDYITIAESIYKPENLTQEDNRNLHLYEKYNGSHTHADGMVVKYRLLVYAGTKIIHTLHPTRSKYNRPRGVKNLRAGRAHWSYDTRRALTVYSIPFYNKSDVELFKLIVRSIRFYPIERWYVQVNGATDHYPVTTFIKEVIHSKNLDYFDIQQRAMILDFGDLSLPEFILRDIMNNKYDFDIGNGEKPHAFVNQPTGRILSFFAW